MKFLSLALLVASLAFVSVSNGEEFTVGKSSNRAHISYTRRNEKETDFVFSWDIPANWGKDNYWMALGFNQNGHMNDASVVVCKHSPTGDRIDHEYTEHFGINMLDQKSPQIGLSNMAIHVEGNKMVCSFTRKNSIEGKSDRYFSFSANGRFQAIVARGEGGIVQYHGSQRFHTKKPMKFSPTVGARILSKVEDEEAEKEEKTTTLKPKIASKRVFIDEETTPSTTTEKMMTSTTTEKIMTTSTTTEEIAGDSTTTDKMSSTSTASTTPEEMTSTNTKTTTVSWLLEETEEVEEEEIVVSSTTEISVAPTTTTSTSTIQKSIPKSTTSTSTEKMTSASTTTTEEMVKVVSTSTEKLIKVDLVKDESSGSPLLDAIIVSSTTTTEKVPVVTFPSSIDVTGRKIVKSSSSVVGSFVKDNFSLRWIGSKDNDRTDFSLKIEFDFDVNTKNGVWAAIGLNRPGVHNAADIYLCKWFGVYQKPVMDHHFFNASVPSMFFKHELDAFTSIKVQTVKSSLICEFSRWNKFFRDENKDSDIRPTYFDLTAPNEYIVKMGKGLFDSDESVVDLNKPIDHVSSAFPVKFY